MFSYSLIALIVFVCAYIIGASYSTFSALAYMCRKNLYSVSSYTPSVLLVIPCKEYSETLESNLRILLKQKYSNFRVVFVSSSEHDDAFLVIKKLIAEYSHATYVASGKTTQCSQKILNQLRAVQEANNEEIFVFADSDSQYPEHWLQSMVAPLEDKTIGATTGCLWLRLDQPSFWAAAMGWAMNTITLPVFTSFSSPVAWGGSLAIRSETFHRIGLADAWSHAVYDDLSFARAVHRAQVRLYFVPEACIQTEVTQKTFVECAQWLRRHMLATRVYMPKLYWRNLIVRMPFMLCALASPWLLLASLYWPSLLNVAIGFSLVLLTRTVCGLVLVIGLRDFSIARYFWHEYTGLILTIVAGLLGSISRTIRWAGIQYTLKSANETRVEPIG